MDLITNLTLLFFLRPAILVIILLLLYHFPTTLYRFRLSLEAIAYLLLCNDKRWKKPKDPQTFFSKEKKVVVEKKTILFIRHGESTWNDTFNKGSHRSILVFMIGFLPGLIKATIYEIWLLLTGKIDSWFYDAPLSHLGLGQANELAKFLSKKQPSDDMESKYISILRADVGAPQSKLLCSNLRRAISTMAVAFKERFERRPNDKIIIIPSLQEISRNPDTLSITPPKTPVTASWIDATSTLCDFPTIFANHIDMSFHEGNKPIKTNGLIRMMQFCDFVFSSSSLKDEEYIIAGGHSIWFRAFFQTFLPYEVKHDSKKRKLVNAGCVAFTLCKTTSSEEGDKYMIDPNSVYVVYGGFK